MKINQFLYVTTISLLFGVGIAFSSDNTWQDGVGSACVIEAIMMAVIPAINFIISRAS